MSEQRLRAGVRVTLVNLTIVVLLVAPLAAGEQAPAKVPRIGLLSPLSFTADTRLEGFLQGLRELGYVDGQTIATEFFSKIRGTLETAPAATFFFRRR